MALQADMINTVKLNAATAFGQSLTIIVLAMGRKL